MSLVNQRKHFEHEQNILSGEIMCSDCGKDKAVYFCKTCDDVKNDPELCEFCKQHHERSRTSQDHKIELLTDTKERLRSSPKNSTKRNAWLCTRHHDADKDSTNISQLRTVSMYCHDCQELICPYCAMTSPHDKHKKQVASELLEKPGEDDPNFKEKMRQQVDRTAAILERFQGAIQDAEEVLSELTESQDKTKQAITVEYDAIIAKLQQQRDTLMIGVDDIFKRKQTNLNTQVQEFKAIEKTMEGIKVFAEEMLNDFIPEEFLFLNHQVQNRLENVCGRYDSYDCTLCEDSIIKFARDNHFPKLTIGEVQCNPHMPAFTAGLTNVFVQNKEITLDIKRCDNILVGNKLQEIGQHKLYACLKSGQEECEGDVVEVNEAQYRVKITPQNPGVQQLHLFTKTGSKEAHIKGSPFNVRVVSQDIHEAHILDGPKYKPWGVAVNESDIVVSDMAHHCLRIFKFKQDNDKFVYVKQIGEEGLEDLQFKTPLGVAINPLNREIIVADNGNHRIHRIAMNNPEEGHHCFGKHGSDKGDFNKPTGVTVSREGIIYVADSGNQRIQYFNQNGDFMGSCGEGMSQPPCFCEPYAITVNNQNKVVIADRRGHKVQIVDHYDPEHQPRARFLFHMSDDDTEEPYGIVSMDGSKNVIISCLIGKSKKSEIRIYSVDGQLIKAYAYQNDGLRSLALKDNYLFVADKVRHKVIAISLF